MKNELLQPYRNTLLAQGHDEAVRIIDAQAEVSATMSAQIAAVKHDHAEEMRRLRASFSACEVAQWKARAEAAERGGYRWCLECQSRAEKAESECAALRDKLEVARAERDTVYEKLNDARAEVEERKTERTEYARAYAAAESRLAAATELLRECTNELVPNWPAIERARAFLAAQPAAPAREQAVERATAALSRTTIWTPRNEAATRCELVKAFDAGAALSAKDP